MAVAYTYIRRNQLRSQLFIVLFALSLMIFIYLSTFGFYVLAGILAYARPTGFLTWGSTFSLAMMKSIDACRWLLPLSVLISVFWARLAIKEGVDFVLARVRRVRPLLKWDAYEAHTILETLCIRTGDPLPQLYEIKDSALNVFSVGAHPEESAIVISSAALEKLSRTELEGVFAHELAHIRNYDVRTMTVMVTCLAFFTFAGEYFFYGMEKYDIYEQSSVDWRDIRPMGPLAYVGLMLMIYGYVVAPLLRLGLSRTRERLADAEAALTTRYPRGLARALWHMSANCRLTAMKNSMLFGALCIVVPEDKPNLFEMLSGLAYSHPPVEERICALNDMDGMFSPVK